MNQPIRKLNASDLDTIVQGACLLGAGGGGGLVMARSILKNVLAFSPQIDLYDPESVGDGEWGAVVAGVGAPSGSSTFKDSPTACFDALASNTGHTFSFALPVETGAANTVMPMLVAAKSQNQIHLLDADGAGRAVPELQITTYCLNDASVEPSVIANEEGYSDVVKGVYSPDNLDSRIREILTTDPHFKDVATLATYDQNGVQLKRSEALVPGTISLSLDVGELLNQSTSARDVCEFFTKKYDRFSLHLDNLQIQSNDFHSEEVGGFDKGTIVIRSDDFEPFIEIDFVNENLVAWINANNKKYPFWSPIMTCYMTPDGAPMSNEDIREAFVGGARSITISLLLISPPPVTENPCIRSFYKELYYRFFPSTPEKQYQHIPLKEIEGILKKG